MRYYIMVVQHNKEKDAENRTVPKAYDKRKDAVREYHRQIADDMGNSTLDRSMILLINSAGGVEMQNLYVDDAAQKVENVAEQTETVAEQVITE